MRAVIRFVDKSKMKSPESKDLCVYCGKANKKPSDEHVILVSLGGRLVTRKVCVACNSKMGSEVDILLSESLIFRLLRFNFKDYLPANAILNFTIDGEIIHG
jgi:hypothetical protein